MVKIYIYTKEFVAYDKAKSYSDRIRRDGKYSAVIFGACPHKTTGIAGFSSAVEMYKQTEEIRARFGCIV